MSPLPCAREPFHFNSRLHLREMTGIKVTMLPDLLQQVKEVSGSVIYHHTHHFLQQHQFLTPEPPNDFAYWVSEVLQEKSLGEKLSSINICDFNSIRQLREKIISTLEDYITKAKGKLREAREGEEFHFMKAISFVLPTTHVANDLREFAEVLKKITVHSIYFHMFEAKLRLEKGTNDFSNWLDASLDEKELARKIAGLDPYTYTMESLRRKIIQLVEIRIAKLEKECKG